MFSLITALTALTAGVLAYFILSFIIKKWDRIPAFNKLKINPDGLRSPLRLLIPVLFLMPAVSFLKIPIKTQLVIIHSLNLAAIALFSWVFIRAVYIARDAILSRFDLQMKDNLKARRVYTQARLIERIMIMAIVFLGISFMLMTFPRVRQIGVSILASAGIMGIILGFAAQKTLGNLIAGIQLAIAQPIRLDDVVIVENEWGRIEEINLMYVVVRIWDMRRLIVPISYFIEHPFQNWTRTSSDILGTVFIYADYKLPVQKLRTELARILENNPLWDRKVSGIQVTDLSERTVEIRALMSAADASSAWDLRCMVREELLSFLQHNFPESLPRTRVELQKDAKHENNS